MSEQPVVYPASAAAEKRGAVPLPADAFISRAPGVYRRGLRAALATGVEGNSESLRNAISTSIRPPRDDLYSYRDQELSSHKMNRSGEETIWRLVVLGMWSASLLEAG